MAKDKKKNHNNGLQIVQSYILRIFFKSSSQRLLKFSQKVFAEKSCNFCDYTQKKNITIWYNYLYESILIYC